MRILIVEDSKAMRMIVRRSIRQAGFKQARIDEVATPLEAWRIIRRAPPDLVVSDWNMPEMTGIELLRRLRGAGVHVPFGFVTSECSREAHELSRQEGAAFLLSKPVTEVSMRAVLTPILQEV